MERSASIAGRQRITRPIVAPRLPENYGALQGNRATVVARGMPLKDRFTVFRLAVLLTACGVSLFAEDWPRWRGPRGDGTWNAPRLPEKWPKDGPKTAWRTPIKAGYSGVSVAGGLVYTLDRPVPTDKSKTPDGQERIFCLSADTGAILWTHTYEAHYGDVDYGSGPRCNPTIHNGRVYTLGTVGTVCCLDAKTGKVLWQRDLRADSRATIPTWGLAASPLIVDDTVVLHAGLPGGSVVALHLDTGKEAWRSLPDPTGYATPLLVERPGGRQLVVWTPQNIRSIDPTTGELFWTVPYPVTYGVSIATPICHDGIVFVSGYWEGSKAIRLGPNPKSMALLYEENQSLRGLMCPPLVRGGRAYLLDKRFGLTCFDLATGKKHWDDGNRMTPRGQNPQATIVWTGHGDQVIALNSDGDLILARLTDAGYVEDSRANVIGPTWANPAFAGDSVYARSDTEIVRIQVAE